MFLLGELHKKILAHTGELVDEQAGRTSQRPKRCQLCPREDTGKENPRFVGVSSTRSCHV